MPGQTQGHQRHQRAREQERRQRPPQHRQARQRHRRGKKRRPPPCARNADDVGVRPDDPRVEHIADADGRRRRKSVRGTSSAAHTAHAPARRPRPQRTVSGGVRDTIVLRWDEERREQERSDGDDGRDLAGRAHERQAIRGDGPRVGKPGGRERIGQRQRTDPRLPWLRPTPPRRRAPARRPSASSSQLPSWSQVFRSAGDQLGGNPRWRSAPRSAA